MSIWASFYSCLPTCCQSKCCAPEDDTVVTNTVEERTQRAVQHTPPPTPRQIDPQPVRPPTPITMTEQQQVRIAHINARINGQHNRLASTDVISINTFLGEKRESVIS